MNIKFKKKYSWLITGGAGFIGSNLINYLLKNNQEVISIDNLSNGSKSNIDKKLTNKENFFFLKKDIRYLKKSDIKKKINFIVHLAALGSVPRSFKYPKLTNDVNVTGSLNILSLAYDLKVQRFIFASSSSVYGESKFSSKKESHSLTPISPYGISKLVFEKYSQVIQNNNPLFSMVILRFFNVFGSNQSHNNEYSAVISKWTSLVIKNKSIILYGDGSTQRDFTHVDNVIAGIVFFCLKNKIKKFTILNLACGRSVSLNYLIECLSNILKKKIKVIKKSFRKGDIKTSLANIKILKKSGFKVLTQFEKGLEKYVKNFKNKRL